MSTSPRQQHVPDSELHASAAAFAFLQLLFL